MEITEFLILIGLTTALTTASTTVIIYNQRQALETSICGKITVLHERLTGIMIRLGIVEAEHKDC